MLTKLVHTKVDLPSFLPSLPPSHPPNELGNRRAGPRQAVWVNFPANRQRYTGMNLTNKHLGGNLTDEMLLLVRFKVKAILPVDPPYSRVPVDCGFDFNKMSARSWLQVFAFSNPFFSNFSRSQLQGGRPTPGHGNNGYENSGSMSRPPAANAGKKTRKSRKNTMSRKNLCE